MAFAEKALQIEIDVPEDRASSGGNTIKLTGYRASAVIDISGGMALGLADIAIYGLPMQMMNNLSQIGRKMLQVVPYGVKVSAGDLGGQMNLVFQGQAFRAWADGQMPNMAFRILGKPGYYQQIAPAAPTSIRGSADVATMLGELAQQMGLTFENNGVTAKLADPYFAGTAMDQAQQIAQAAGVDLIIDKNIMAITPEGVARKGDVPLISPKTGMIGYPAFDSTMIEVLTIFNPAIQPFGAIKVESELTAACGTYQVTHMSHMLDSITPGGRWHTAVTGAVPGSP